MRRKLILIMILVVALLAFGGCSRGQTTAPAGEPSEMAATAPAAGEVDTAVFTINPGESTARFELEEDLRSALTGWALGARITVVGTTDQITGDFSFDPENPTAAEFGTIRINADTLETNEFFRNRAIRNQILNTDVYEFITFQPTSAVGLPDSVTIGESVTFNLVGDLTIRDITRSESFVVTATLASPTEIIGTASTLIARDDYDLTIPSVANVTFVEDMVELYIDFVSRR